MSNERWVRVQELFERALGVPPGKRDAMLATECGDDVALAAEVRGLLAHHARSSGFLETGGADVRAFAAGVVPSPPLPAGTGIGAWRIVRTLGEGGMGTVYLAERTEGGFRQQGALKLIRQGLASEEMIRRFLRERQILASLEHPQIARLLDGGTTPDGLPWLVMEYVEGRPLYDDCSERRLSVEQRLRLFLQVASAVQYAHGRLVLHRDIKPGNLLIAADGSPRLLDFGIGKALDVSLSSTQDVRTIVLPMTPEYASPEQLRGEEVGVASDVYSLGVLLYELLTGTRPYAASSSAREFVEQVLSREPERPSTAVTTASPTRAAEGAGRRLPDPPAENPVTLRRHLAGDLDNIVLKAMHKDVARRYASVEQLALDLERYLGGYPVLARPDSWGYRASKYVRRNRVGLAAASVAVLALVGGLGVALWQAGVARDERALAQRRFEDVHGLSKTLLFDVNDAIASLPGSTPARALILASATRYLDRLSHDAGRDTALLADLGEAYARLGTIQGVGSRDNVGQTAEAHASLERSRALFVRLRAIRPRSVRALVGLLQADNNLGLYAIDHNRPEEGLRMQLEAGSLMEQLVSVAPESLNFRRSMPRRLYNLGFALHAAGRDSEGFVMVRRGLDGFVAMTRAFPDDPTNRQSLAQAYTGLADLLMLTGGNTDSVEAAVHRSMALQEPILRERPDDLMLRRRYAANLGYLSAVAMSRPGQLDTALVLQRRVTAIVTGICEADPGNVDMRVGLGTSRVNEGYLDALTAHAGDAEAMLRAQLVQSLRWYAADSTDSRVTDQIETAHEGLGIAAIARARAASLQRRPAAEQWRSARGHLGEAKRFLQAFRAAGDKSYEASGRVRGVETRLASCDSALAVATALRR